jgi:imidazoleglycerol-phosphate dehydratase
MADRTAQITRVTSETSIDLSLNLDGSSKINISTGFGLADHMLDLMAFWSGFDLDLTCRGDIHIDAHHTLEDSALVLGQALLGALGERKGITRVGWARVPMDDALADVSLDLSGRPCLVYHGAELLPPLMAGEERDLWREFFKSLAAGARMNLHISYQYGLNGHHLLESACKGLGLALRQAVTQTREHLLSTKGSLD